MAVRNARSLRVAALQLRSEIGAIQANLVHAEGYIDRAARAGAHLLVLPELFGPGYVANEDVWRLAEPPQGLTERWLARTAARHGVYLGTGFAYTDGTDVFNVFALAAPDGSIAGIVRKTNAEAYAFRRHNGNHVIETGLGAIGVGICADNEFVPFLREMQERQVDLILMPHAWPTAVSVGGAVSERDIRQSRQHMEQLPLLYARQLGVPVIFVNAVGPIARMSGLIGKLMAPAQFRCQGQSRIVDSDARVSGQLGDEEDLLIGDIVLDPARKKMSEPTSYGGWVMPGSALPRKVVIPLDAAIGMLMYRVRVRQRRAALAAVAHSIGAPAERATIS